MAKGTAVGHYIANVRDIEFNLFEVFRLGEVLDAGGYGDLDADTVRTMLEEVARLAEGPVAASFADADRHPPVFDPETHSISVPANWLNRCRPSRTADWWRIGIAEEIGGVPAPAPLAWAVNEMLLCANSSAGFCGRSVRRWPTRSMSRATSSKSVGQQRLWSAAGRRPWC